MRTIIDITTLWASIFKTSIRFTKKKKCHEKCNYVMILHNIKCTSNLNVI